MALTDKLKAIANAIRGKTGGTEELTLDQMATAIEGIEVGGTGGVVVCEEVEPEKAITLANLKDLRISFPNAESVGYAAFYGCTSLASVDLPVATTIGESAFHGCTSLVNFNLPVATSTGLYSFMGCTSLTSVNLPVTTSIGSNAFADCTSLTSVNLPVTTGIGEGAFDRCTSLASINLPAAASIGAMSFINCTSLTSVDLPVTTSIGDGAFYRCTNLSTLILRNAETVCQINMTAVLGTKIVTEEGAPIGEGFIYIPTSMFEYYRAAYEPAFEQMGAAGMFDILFRKIEDYPEICGT